MQHLQHLRCQNCGNIHPNQPCAALPAKFIWPYPAKQVYLYGSWNQFQVKELMNKRGEGFQCLISLPVGMHQYKFEVDGQWCWDEKIQKVEDNHGSYNNLIYVHPKRAYQTIELHSKTQTPFALIRLFEEAEEVLGSWDNWQVPVQLKCRDNKFIFKKEYYAYLNLPQGEYQFIFKRKNGTCFNDPCQPSIKNAFGGFNNLLVLRFNQPDSLELNYNHVTWQKYDFLYHKFDHLYGHTMTSIGNALYVFGGAPSSNEIYKLRFGDQSMLLLEDVQGEVPRPRAYHNALPYGDKILFFGGVDDHSVLSDHFVYISSINKWQLARTEGKLLQKERASLTFYALEELVVYFGGYYASEDFEFEEVYNEVQYMNIQHMQWHTLKAKNPPEPRYGHSATQINEKMFVFGGRNQQVHFNDVWVLNFESIEWNKLEVKGIAPEPRYGHSANLFKSKICIYGGRGSNSQRLGDLFFFDFIMNIWIQPEMHGTIPVPRYFHASDVHDEEQLWIMGGNIGMKRNEHFYIMTFGNDQQFLQQ